jgi:outer membrane protein assembly factor BamB
MNILMVLPMLALLFLVITPVAASSILEDRLERVAVVHIPGAPQRGWCFDLGAVVQQHYILANASQRELTVINDGNDTLQPPIGAGDFTGEAGCHKGDYSGMGPEGVLIDDGKVYAGNGKSQVEVFSMAGTFLSAINTGGKHRADEMAISQGLLAVTNPDEAVPFLSMISLQSRHIIKKIDFPQSAGVGLEQPQFYDGKLYISNPVGEVDVLNLANWRMISIPVPDCVPAGLSIDEDGEAAVGCAAGQQALLNLRQGTIIARVNVSDVDVVAHLGDHFFFASYGSDQQVPQVVSSDAQGMILARQVTTSESHTVTVDPSNGHILVPFDGGTILVFREDRR